MDVGEFPLWLSGLPNGLVPVRISVLFPPFRRPLLLRRCRRGLRILCCCSCEKRSRPRNFHMPWVWKRERKKKKKKLEVKFRRMI